MAEVAVVTDSVACLPPDLVQQYQIGVVPVEVHFEGRTYRDGVDITAEEVFAWLGQAKKLPTTSAPPPAAFLEVFQSRREREILCITVASRVSAVFDSARLAAAAIPQKAVEVIDSGTATMAEGFLALAAAREAALGKGLGEVIETVRRLLPRVNVIAFLDTLYYLVKGGRVPWVAAWASSLLQIKPLLQIAHGEVSLLGRARTKAKALERLLALMRQRLRKGAPLYVAIHHANNQADAEMLKERIVQEFSPSELYLTPFTPVMGVHTGPGLVGLAFYNDD